eukprot:1325155-Amphidinium_carterae.1
MKGASWPNAVRTSAQPHHALGSGSWRCIALVGLRSDSKRTEGMHAAIAPTRLQGTISNPKTKRTWYFN